MDAPSLEVLKARLGPGQLELVPDLVVGSPACVELE